MNNWTPNFDPEAHIPMAVPIWVRLPNLPMHCWNPKLLNAIGNTLGRYIDMASLKDQYACARTCVEVDLEARLPEAIKLTVGNWHHFQKLDYKQLPFKCRGCHEYEHFYHNYPQKKEGQQEKEEGSQSTKRSKTKAKSGEMQRKHGGETNKGKSPWKVRPTRLRVDLVL